MAFRKMTFRINKNLISSETAELDPISKPRGRDGSANPTVAVCGYLCALYKKDAKYVGCKEREDQGDVCFCKKDDCNNLSCSEESVAKLTPPSGEGKGGKGNAGRIEASMVVTLLAPIFAAMKLSIIKYC